MSEQDSLEKREELLETGTGTSRGAARCSSDGPAATRTSIDAIRRRSGGGAVKPAPGKRSLVQARYSNMSSGQAAQPSIADRIEATAAQGVQGASEQLPHLDRIQASFGHDLQAVRAQVGGPAGPASEAMGAEAYATGNQVAFRGPPDLHTAAHEAAHVVQQREGVQLEGGVGKPGDPYEQQADRAADAVVRGESAATVLGVPGRSSETATNNVQQKQDDDWQVRRGGRESVASFGAVAVTQPEAARVPLGKDHKQRYWIVNAERAPKQAEYHWHHGVRGATAAGTEMLSDAQQTGPRSEVELTPRVSGKKTITSRGTQKLGGGEVRGFDVPTVKIETPAPKKAGAPVLESISQDGNRRPVLDTFAQGEDLLVTVVYDNIDPAVETARSVLKGADNLEPKTVEKVGPGAFTATLGTRKAGTASGTLFITPLETESGDVPPIALKLKVEALGSEDDPGSRPQNLDNAVEWLSTRMGVVFERRKAAVNDVYGQSKEKDPPPQAPRWREFMVSVAEIALAAVTAGIGVKVAEALVDSHGATHEVIKVFTEHSLARSVEAAAGDVLGGGESAGTAGRGKGIKLALGLQFRDVQKKALEKEGEQATTRGLTEHENRARRLEKQQPGSGFRYVMRICSALDQSFETAHDLQYFETFQSWCSLLARNQLNSEGDDPGATNLDRVVDKADVVATKGNLYPEGPEKVPGVLRLELAEQSNRVVEDSRSGWTTHPLRVARATISGLDSQAFCDTVGLAPIRELKMSVVAWFTSARDTRGFIIGRNEGPQYWAEGEGEDLVRGASLRAGRKLDERGAAKYILDQEIGGETVEPKKT